MSINITNEIGSISIDDQVVASIAGMSAMECYGVVGMATKSATEGFLVLMKKEQLSKGVRVHSEEEKITIELHIVLQFGVRISVVAENIISKVKYNVESLVGIEVNKVNIFVQGVRVQK